ncbi:Fe-binding Fe/S cluster assembly protein [Starmerella bacillaris]|uniref:Iron-sulfur assembly protein 1 n=1 Tax=Starmerella bacillaris TaxID=1247836 RepID=A0AAV5RGW8_STABA|nr:Fe-binding Fe/S cluster assembly protein [Starmerella bacillaris]
MLRTTVLRPLSPFRSMQMMKPLRPWNSHRLTNKIPQSSATEHLNQNLHSSKSLQPETPAPKTLVNSAATQVDVKKRRRPLKPLRAVINLKPAAVSQLRKLLSSPTPQLIRVGVRNRGCSGLIYHLEYVDRPGKFDEEVEQDGVKVLIDSKALFSVIGSDMDYHDDGITAKFVFNNPNAKGSCGCGESFMV